MSTKMAILVGLCQVSPAAYGGWNGVNGCEGVAVAIVGMGFIIGTHVLLLGTNEAPNFIALNALAWQVAHGIVLVQGTGFAHICNQLEDGVFALSCHP